MKDCTLARSLLRNFFNNARQLVVTVTWNHVTPPMKLKKKDVCQFIMTTWLRVMFIEEWIGKDVQGSGFSIVWGSILEFTSPDWGKLRQIKSDELIRRPWRQLGTPHRFVISVGALWGDTTGKCFPTSPSHPGGPAMWLFFHNSIYLLSWQHYTSLKVPLSL